jgi:hypothetical protein
VRIEEFFKSVIQRLRQPATPSSSFLPPSQCCLQVGYSTRRFLFVPRLNLEVRIPTIHVGQVRFFTEGLSGTNRLLCGNQLYDQWRPTRRNRGHWIRRGELGSPQTALSSPLSSSSGEYPFRRIKCWVADQLAKYPNNSERSQKASAVNDGNLSSLKGNGIPR